MKAPLKTSQAWMLALLTAAFSVSFGDAAAAAPFLDQANAMIVQVYDSIRSIIYYVGGLGLIVLAIFAFFGRFKWTHFFALAGGLFLVGATDQLIKYLGQQNI